MPNQCFTWSIDFFRFHNLSKNYLETHPFLRLFLLFSQTCEAQESYDDHYTQWGKITCIIEKVKNEGKKSKKIEKLWKTLKNPKNSKNLEKSEKVRKIGISENFRENSINLHTFYRIRISPKSPGYFQWSKILRKSEKIGKFPKILKNMKKSVRVLQSSEKCK